MSLAIIFPLAVMLSEAHAQRGQHVAYVQGRRPDRQTEIPVRERRTTPPMIQEQPASVFQFGDLLLTHLSLVSFLADERVHFSAPKNPWNKRGVYLTANTVANEEFLADTIDAVHVSQGNAIVIDVKGSFVYFPALAPTAHELELVYPLYELPEIVQYLHEQGIYVIARYIAAKDPVFSVRNPEVRIRHPRSNVSVSTVWIDPSHPLVLQYNREVLSEVALAGVDEINLDYIRYPTEYPQSLIGLSGEEKADRVLQFVQMAREVIDTHNPHVQLGLSTYAILGWNYEVNLEPLGQDFVRFAPYVDVISPMAYPATFAVGAYYNPEQHPVSRMYYLVYRTMKGYAELLGDEHRHKLRPWIQGYSITVKNVRDQIQAVFDTGSCGFTFWNANNRYAFIYVGMQAVEVPAECL